MEHSQYGQQFENIVKELFQTMDFQIEDHYKERDKGYDLILKIADIQYFVEAKFYRSHRISASILRGAANKLAYQIGSQTNNGGLVVLSAITPKKLKEEIATDYGIEVWDRNDLFGLMNLNSIDLRERFEQLLLDTQQGTEPYRAVVGADVEKALDDYKLTLSKTHAIKVKEMPSNRGQQLYNELQLVNCGKTGWAAYETKCIEILKFLFDDDLALWEKQNNTDDGLSRFDLICRIASRDDYWKALSSSFNTRFVLFEFKNYCEEIDQGQIYTTERYLYNKALRSVAFIVARNGAKPNAIDAAKGALKEHGKLIVILTDNDLKKMLSVKDNNESPNDYLSDLLDVWLISLSR
ncbi:restriction endonuclease [Dyadobacter jiangsuensis]